MDSLTVSKRAPKRSRVFLSAAVESGDAHADARIRDISNSGALLESDYCPSSGEALRVICGDTSLAGRVAWAERGWFGMEFDTPLAIGSLADSAGTKLAVSAPRTYRAADALE